MSDSNKDTQKKEDFFSTDDLMSDLKGHSVRGGAVTILSQAIKFILQTSSTIVLARLLTPNDYGLIAMVSTFINFANLFKDLGLSMATIQKKDLSHQQVSNLFWINIVVSCLLMCVIAVISPVVANFYSEPRLMFITIAISCTFMFSGLVAQHTAIMRRHMHFHTLAIIEITSMAAGFIAAIIAAFLGMTYWSLVIMTILRGIFNVIMVWLFSDWRPGKPVLGSGTRPMIVFGGYITMFNIVNYFARNFDNILIGRFWGADTLGLYNKAYNIMMLPLTQLRNPLQAVAIPALSRIQNDQVRYKSYYTKLVTFLALITMPLMVFLFVCADPVIRLLLGDQWSGAIKIFKILCIVAFIQPVAFTTGIVFISLGKSKRYFTIGMISSIIYVVAFIIGLPWGAVGVAIAYTVTNYVTLVPTLWYCFNQSPLSITDFFSAILRPAIASLCMGIAIFLCNSLLFNQPHIIVIGACLVFGFLVYLGVLCTIPGGIRMIRDFLSLGLLILPKETGFVKKGYHKE